MSNANNEMIIEGLGDEYYDDPAGCMAWLANALCDEAGPFYNNEALEADHLHEQKVRLRFLTEEEQCEEYVNYSMEMMAQ
jgi:hypothetical protein